MPHISSTDRLLITAQDMTDALKHPHTDVPFSTIVYDTMTALITSSAIITKKTQQYPSASNNSGYIHDAKGRIK